MEALGAEMICLHVHSTKLRSLCHHPNHEYSLVLSGNVSSGSITERILSRAPAGGFKHAEFLVSCFDGFDVE